MSGVFFNLSWLCIGLHHCNLQEHIFSKVWFIYEEPTIITYIKSYHKVSYDAVNWFIEVIG
jgi:hypothetical protein